LAIAQGTLPWQPRKLGKSAFFAYFLSRCYFDMDWNIGTQMSSLFVHDVATECGYIVYKYTVMFVAVTLENRLPILYFCEKKLQK